MPFLSLLGVVLNLKNSTPRRKRKMRKGFEIAFSQALKAAGGFMPGQAVGTIFGAVKGGNTINPIG